MKRGFTLIELLAVIVILAIIALIAVPVLLNIINDSKTSSGEETVKLYMDTVKKAITRKQLEISNFNPSICTIKENGNLLCDEEEIVVDMKGIKPNKGVIEISNNKLTYKNLLLNGIYYNEKGILVDDADNNNEISMGDKYRYKVNNNDTFNFYVLSTNSDNTVNLIMDRNICNDGTVEYTSENNYCRYKWNSNNTNGPEVIMLNLYLGTKEWNNVPNMNFIYDDTIGNDGNSGYKQLIINDGIGKIIKKNNNEILLNLNDKPMKARLSTLSEMNYAGCTEDLGSCSIWLIENLMYINISNNKYLINKNNGINTIYGYWLLSSNATFNDRGRFIEYKGRTSNTTSRISNSYGARPVITVPITDLLN